MAYVLGRVRLHELVALVQRGWEPENVPDEMTGAAPAPDEEEPEDASLIWVMFWVDNDLFDMMSGDDWETESSMSDEEAVEGAGQFLKESGQEWRVKENKDAN